MAENKTTATEKSVDAYIASRAKNHQAADCRALMALFEKLTEQPPKMWGPSIVGYGSYRYTYESGRTGNAPRHLPFAVVRSSSTWTARTAPRRCFPRLANTR